MKYIKRKITFGVLLMVKSSITTQVLIKRDPTQFSKNLKYLVPAGSPGNGFWIITWWLFIFRGFFFFDITASNFWLKETQFGCFWTIPNPNEYRERDQGNGRGLGYFNKLIVPDPKIVPVIFTFSEVYEFHFKSQSPWPDGKLDCYKLVPVYIISKINGNEAVHKYKK